MGKSTHSSLKAIRETHPNSHSAPTDIRGASSGTSEQLAKFIVSDLASSPLQKRLLYLTGDKNRDNFPDILQRENVQLSPLQVYQTQGSSSFPDDLKLALESPTHQGTDPCHSICLISSSSFFFQSPVFGGSCSLRHPLQSSLHRLYDITSTCNLWIVRPLRPEVLLE